MIPKEKLWTRRCCGHCSRGIYDVAGGEVLVLVQRRSNPFQRHLGKTARQRQTQDELKELANKDATRGSWPYR